MKQKTFFTILLLSFTLTIFAQVPAVNLKDINGKSVNTKSIKEMQRPVVVIFFGTWCMPCIRLLNGINKEYDKWQEETNVEIIAISLDNARKIGRVKKLLVYIVGSFPFG